MYYNGKIFFRENVDYMVKKKGTTVTAIKDELNKEDSPYSISGGTFTKYYRDNEIQNPVCVQAFVDYFNKEMGTNFSATDFLHTNLEERLLDASDIIGCFWGVYLDPLGTGSLRYMFLNIEKDTNNEIKVKAFSEIRYPTRDGNTKNKIECFVKNDYSNLKKETFTEFLQKYFLRGGELLSGRVVISRGIVTIELEDDFDGDHKMDIMLNISGFLKGKRMRTSDNRGYRGGLGLAVVLNSQYGTYCTRIGLIRNDYLAESILAGNNEELKSKLNLLGSGERSINSPFKLSELYDARFYNFIMEEHEKERWEKHGNTPGE